MFIDADKTLAGFTVLFKEDDCDESGNFAYLYPTLEFAKRACEEYAKEYCENNEWGETLPVVWDGDDVGDMFEPNPHPHYPKVSVIHFAISPIYVYPR